MHKTASLILGLCIMGLSAWAVVSARAWPSKAALFPLVIGIPVFCLAAAEVLWGLFGPAARSETPDLQLSQDLPVTVALRRTALALAWILGFFAAIVLLGFPVAVPVFVFLYLTLQGRERRGLSLIFAVAIWMLFYGLFDRLLHLPFPDGLLQTWAGVA